MWHTSKCQLSDTCCSMALWCRKEPFSHCQAWAKRSLIVLHNCVHQYGSALTARVTCRHVRRAERKIAKKLREIAENCGTLRNCGKLRKIADLNSHPLQNGPLCMYAFYIFLACVFYTCLTLHPAQVSTSIAAKKINTKTEMQNCAPSYT